MSKTITFRKFHSGQKEISQGLGKYSVLRCGRRFGKTTQLEDIGSHRGARGLQVGWFAPSYKLIIPSYRRILTTLRPIVETASKIDGLITTSTGGSVEFWSLDNEDAGRSRSYDLVIIDEGSLKKKGLRDIWEQAIKPTLLDRDGNAIMAGTPKGIDEENYFYIACTNPDEGWKHFHYPTWKNPHLNAGAVAKLKDENSPLVWQQEYAAEFVDWSGVAFFPLANLLDNGQPVTPTMNCDCVFAIVDTALKAGNEHDGTAVIYFGLSKHHGYPLVILDWDIVQISGDLLENWMPNVYRHCDTLATELRARNGSLGAFIEDKQTGTILIQQAIRRGLPGRAIDSKLTAVGKDERSISVSGYVFQGKVKISTHAFAKVVNFKGVVKNHCLAQICGYRVGVKDQADDLEDCFTYGISIGIADSKGY